MASKVAPEFAPQIPYGMENSVRWPRNSSEAVWINPPAPKTADKEDSPIDKTPCGVQS